MVDIPIQIERNPPKPHRTGLGNTETRYRVLYNGEEIGVWRYPAYSAARKLVELGHAKRDDVLQVYRGSAPAMRGSIGWLADHTIVENDIAGLHVVKWRPMPEFD